jgi:hypothetical protein
MIITIERSLGKFGTIKTYEFDATISRELRETEKQIAIELKQWSGKVDHKFDPVEWLKTASAEELQAALPGVRTAREKLLLKAKGKPN